jgi:hypothetical protein
MGFFATSDADAGGNSASEVFISREEINGVTIDSVLNIKTNLARRENGVELYASAYTDRQVLMQQLRKANGIRFKAIGDGKPWQVEFHTPESYMGEIFFCYIYLFSTIRDKVIDVDIPYTSIYLPEYWEKYRFEFDKEKIVTLSIGANFLQGYGPSSLQIFDFEIY